MKLSYKKLIPLILLFVVVGLFLVEAKGVQAAIIPSPTDIAMAIIKFAAWVFFQFLGFLVTICALVFEGVLNFGFTSDLQGIIMGWTICRDIVNMFFILGLVVIAFATILRFETYGMKALLPKLIIIAILINFSFLICGIIIDASQIIADYFIDKIKGKPAFSIGVRLLDALRISSAFDPNEDIGTQALQAISAIDNFIKFVISTCILGLVLVLTCVALIVGAILLLIRIGALWILMILAPFAWFFSIFPGLKALSKKWWDNFLKYAFFAPIYVFFIYLIVSISPAIFNQGQTVIENNVDKTFLQTLGSFALSKMAGDANLIFGFVFVVMLLLGAPVIATSMGLHATSAVVKTYQGIKGKAAALPWKGLRNALQKFDRDVLSPRGLSPRAFIEGWKLRKARVEEEKMKVPIAEAHDRLNRWFGKEKTFYAERARDELRQKHQEIVRKQGLTPEGLGNIINECVEAIQKGQLDRIHELKGALLQAIDQADEEGVMLNDELGKKYGHLTSLKNYQQLIKDVIGSAEGEEEAVRFAGQVGALAKQRGIHYLDGMTRYDSTKKKMDWTPEDELGDKAAMELSKLSSRYIYQYSNRRNFFAMGRDGNAAEPSELLRHFLGRTTFDEAHLQDLNRYMAPETVTYIRKYLEKGNNEQEFQKMVEDIAKKKKNASAVEWFATLKAKMEGTEYKYGKAMEEWKDRQGASA